MGEIRVREIAPTAYSEFLCRFPHSAFHRIAWLDAIAKTFGLRIRLLGYFQGEQLLAVTPLMGRRMGPFMIWGAPLRKCATPPATLFCTPEEQAPELIAPLRKWVTEQRLGYVQITVPCKVEIESYGGASIERLDNLELNLRRPLKTIWKDLAQQKTSVRKAIRSGVTLHWRNGEDALRIQEALVRATYSKQGIRPNIPEHLYRELMRGRSQAGVQVLTAAYAGETIAAAWIFTDMQRCYYWDAASLDASRDLNANHLLVWCLIRWAHRKGYDTLDFVGTSTGGRGGSRPGIGRFKQSMGGRSVEYRLIYWYSPIMQMAFAGYRFIARVRARLRAIRRGNHANPV